MRHLLLTATLTLITFAPPSAFAQGDEAEDQGDVDTSAPVGSSTIAPEKRRQPSSTGKASSPGTQHTVENLGSARVELILVELKAAPGARR